jgi:hypothetical protein
LVIHILYACDLLRFRFDVSFLFLAFNRSSQRNCPIVGDDLDVLRIGGKRVIRCEGLSYVLSDGPVGLTFRLIAGSFRFAATISYIAAGIIWLDGGSVSCLTSITIPRTTGDENCPIKNDSETMFMSTSSKN